MMRKVFTKKISVRIVTFIIALTFIIGIFFYISLLRTISDFVYRQIETTLKEISRDIYMIYDDGLNELSSKGLLGNEKMIRIEQARILNKFEEFMRIKNIKGIIVSEGGYIAGLNMKGFPGELQVLYDLSRRFRENEVSYLSFGGKDFYAIRINLEIWKWHILILKDAEGFASLFVKVRRLHIMTAIILILSALLLMVYLKKTINKPIEEIISSIKRGERPEYKGIEEFEFLSRNIKDMMESLERETRLLNYVYYIAATKKGEDFFDEVVRAINHLFNVNSLVARIEEGGETAHVLSLYLNGEIRKGFSFSLEGRPCKDVLGKKGLVVIERGVSSLYPNAETLTNLGAESYIGLAILDRKGQPIGILEGFGDARDYTESDIKVLQLIGQIVATEIERIEEEKEKEKIRDQLFQVQKMEAIGTLAGGIAHDFNNMLQGILGYASLLKEKIPPTDPIYRPIDVIERTAERAAELTKQLLGFARKGKFFVETLNINDLVDELMEIISRTFDRSIEIKTDLSKDIWLFKGDKGQIVSVLLNLCVNARDAMPGGGILTISTYNREVKEADFPFSWARPGSYVVITVKDTGVGMDQETMKHIFEPFFTTKEKGKGTGMGLAMVYGVVKDHGGFITVDSELGRGSIFTIYLPATKEKIEKEGGKIKASAAGSGTTL